MTTKVENDNRRLRFLLKQANKIMGRQGQTIHQLRAEKEELLSLHSKIERGDLRRYERQIPELIEETENLMGRAKDLIKANEDLRAKIEKLEAEQADATKGYVKQ